MINEAMLIISIFGFFVIPILLYYITYVRPKRVGEKSYMKELRHNMTSKIAFYVEDKDKAEQAIGVLLENTDDKSEIFGVFNNATFPKIVQTIMEGAIAKGARFKILMRCEGQQEYEDAKWLYEQGKKNNNVEINNYDKPKPSRQKLPRDPGNFRMIINSRSLDSKKPASIIGIQDPISKIYAGIFIKDKTFFDFMKRSFLGQFRKYEKFRG